MFGDVPALKQRAQALALSVPMTAVSDFSSASETFATALPVRPVPSAVPVVPGRPDQANAASVIAAIEQAAAAVAKGIALALVTNPIAKNVLYDAGFLHPGHTEYLAEHARRHAPGSPHRAVMMLVCEELKVVPLTSHIPLAEVPAAITSDRLDEVLRITHRALIEDFGVATPRIAVSGLNPHAGENATLGTEERDVISPAIERLAADGLDVFGPRSADTLFHEAARASYDAAVTMYHDQALIPLKTLAFDRGVNVTLGLPFVRTSPDHGTAFDIAGSGRASAESLIAALIMADQLATRRSHGANAP